MKRMLCKYIVLLRSEYILIIVAATAIRLEDARSRYLIPAQQRKNRNMKDIWVTILKDPSYKLFLKNVSYMHLFLL
jgi:hypothetical protein